MSQPLVSIIVLSYKNYRYLYEALDSVLIQDYPNIEIIVSNDGSDDFKEKEVEKYFSKKKKKNIKNIVIINNKNNLGTVKSLNNAIKMAGGKYINFFAADDAFYDKRVVSNFIKSFKKLPKNEYVVTSQLAMYDMKLEKVIQLFVKKNDIKLLKNATPSELFNKMALRCIVAAASTCYNKALFKKYGYFDEKYKLVEDYSSALKFSRLGIKFNYFDFISFKHRDGGISHGNINGEKKLNKQYDLDILNIMKNEILPYVNLLDTKQKTAFMEKYKDYKWRFEYKYDFKNATKIEQRKFVAKNWKVMLFGLYKDLKQYLIDQLVGKKFKLFLIGLFLLIISFLKIDFIVNNPSDINRITKFVGLFLIFGTSILALYQVYKLCGVRLIKIIRFIL